MRYIEELANTGAAMGMETGPVATPHPAPESAGTLLRAYKADRLLELWIDGALEHACPIGLGFEPVGHKEREGDGKTPEGEYFICVRNDRSGYHLSLGISYPGAQDAGRALSQKMITQDEHDAILAAAALGKRPPWDTPLGGGIMVHGNGGGSDWTAGCIAVDDGDMDILFDRIPLGTRVEIHP